MFGRVPMCAYFIPFCAPQNTTCCLALICCTAVLYCCVVPPACSTWVTINTETRRPAKIPEDVKQRFRQLAPSPPRFAIAKDEARKKLPEFVWPSQVRA
jgi:hypothetical protein